MTHPDLYDRAFDRTVPRPAARKVDPALQESRDKIRRLASEARVKVRTLDPGLDQALGRLAALESEASSARARLADLSRRVQSGEVPAEVAARLRSAIRETAEREVVARAREVEKEVLEARRRALSAFLPTVEADGAKSRELKEDLTLALDAGGKDPSSAFAAAWRQATARGDRRALAILAGDWGRNQWATRGGDPRSFDDIATGLVTDAVNSEAFANVESVARLKALHSKTVTEASVGTREAVRIAVDDIGADE